MVGLCAKLGEGEIRLAFPAREDACGCRNDIWIESMDGHQIHFNRDDDARRRAHSHKHCRSGNCGG